MRRHIGSPERPLNPCSPRPDDRGLGLEALRMSIIGHGNVLHRRFTEHRSQKGLQMHVAQDSLESLTVEVQPREKEISSSIQCIGFITRIHQIGGRSKFMYCGRQWSSMFYNSFYSPCTS